MTPAKSITPAPRKTPPSRGRVADGASEGLRDAGSAILGVQAEPKMMTPAVPARLLAVKSAASKRPSVDGPVAKSARVGAGITAEQRRSMISEAAYYQAERRGFSGGDPVQDWIAAEAEVDRLLSGLSH